MKLIGSRRTDFALSLGLVLIWCALPSVCLFLNNAAEMPFRDILLPCGCFVLLGALCFFLSLLVFRNSDLAGLLTAVGMGLFLNFNFIIDLGNAIHPSERLRPHYIAAAVLFAALFALLLLLKRKKPELLQILSRLTLLAACVILLISLVFAVPTLMQSARNTKFRQTKFSADVGVTRPNLYYLLTDEYASFGQLQEAYGFDNSAFRDFLTERGFCVSDSSYNRHNNSMPNMTEVANLAPVITNTNDSLNTTNRFNNALLYSILEDMGYDLYQIGNLYPFPELMPYAQTHVVAENGAAATEMLITNSMLRPFSRALYWETVFESRESSFAYFGNPAHYAKSNRATFFYVCSPHVPYYNDANGNRVDMDQWMNRDDPQYYLGQLQYMTGRLEMMIDSILENDPTAIILLQSDHGQRKVGSVKGQHRILNALYMGGGDPVDITGLSGYNTWRALLNALGESYPILPEEPIFDK